MTRSFPIALVAAALVAFPAAAAKSKGKKKPLGASTAAPAATGTPTVLDVPDPPFVEKTQGASRPKSAEATVYAALEPALVSVTVTRTVERGGFSQGSAFAVHSSGLFVTNFHVVNNAAEITLRFSDGRSYPARLAGAEPSIDLAVLRADAPEGATRPVFAVAALGDSDTIQPGDPVLALGVPLGMGPTITRGILSGKDRRVDVATFGIAGFDVGFLQTDAAINAGSSGGPLVDLDGGVIGVTSATLPSARGISFAIPINSVKKALPEMLRHAGISRAWLGLTLAAPAGSGADVIGVRPGGPADRAGLRTGDVVTEIRGRDLRTERDLADAVKDLAVHETVEVRYRRKSKVLSALLTAADVPLPGVARADDLALGGAKLAEFGPTSDAAVMSGQSSGVLFAAVPLGSGADKAGVKTGDVVVVLGMDSVSDLDDVRILLDRIGDADAFRLLVRRGEKTLTVICPR
jgi:serine protease Do